VRPTLGYVAYRVMAPRLVYNPSPGPSPSPNLTLTLTLTLTPTLTLTCSVEGCTKPMASSWLGLGLG
jgi:hypothetical protein